MFKSCISLSSVLMIMLHAYTQNPVPGHLANAGFENEPVKSVFFFTGNWRNGVQFYDYNPSDNRGLFTLHPADSRHLGWSENRTHRDYAIQTMLNAGVNVIHMSYWGLPGTDNWAYWSPMQSSTASHDELFTAAVDKDILIAPYLESYAATENSDAYIFADDFPGTSVSPAPLLIERIEDLVNRYLVNPADARWPSQWARLYDQEGQERYLLSIIHVASNQEAVTDKDFAAGFDLVAGKVFERTGVHVGFAVDILPPDTYAPGTFKATPLNTGPWLAKQKSILVVQCFLPEIWTGMNIESDLIAWKNAYHSSWIKTGIPFVYDLTPGYDAHMVFPESPVYGNTQSWRDLQSQAIKDFGSRSMTFNSWNGFTEGMAGMPTTQYGDATYLWLCAHFGGECSNSTEGEIYEANQEGFRIFPNPVLDHAEIRIINQGEQFISYAILDCNGILLRHSTTINASSDQAFRLPAENLLPGLYFLLLKTDKSIYVRKMLKAG